MANNLPHDIELKLDKELEEINNITNSRDKLTQKQIEAFDKKLNENNVTNVTAVIRHNWVGVSRQLCIYTRNFSTIDQKLLQTDVTRIMYTIYENICDYERKRNAENLKTILTNYESLRAKLFVAGTLGYFDFKNDTLKPTGFSTRRFFTINQMIRNFGIEIYALGTNLNK